MPDSVTLSFERTVPCSLAHRRALGEVFVADTAQTGADEFMAAIQIPRAHSLWSDHEAGYHDPLSTVEAMRQAITVIGHRYLDIPSATPASMQKLGFAVEDMSAYRDSFSAPLEGIARIRGLRRTSSYSAISESSFEATLNIGMSVALTLRGDAVHFSAETYQQMRAHQQTGRVDMPGTAESDSDPVQPDDLGRRDIQNVVIGAPRPPGGSDDGRKLTPLIVDQRHPSFFDHSYDHVPGPLLLEGCRQAAILAAVECGVLRTPTVGVTGCEITFSGFAELGPVVWYSPVASADPDSGGAQVELGVHQFGTQIAHCSIELSPHPSTTESL